jgi:hypothetical protein
MVANDAERGCAAPPTQDDSAVLLNDDQALAQLIHAAARSEAYQSE